MSASQISNVSKLVGSIIGIGADILVDTAEFTIDRNGFKLASIASRSAILAFNVISTVNAFSNFSDNTSKALKTTELVIRGIDLPIQIAKQVSTAIKGKTKFSASKVIEMIQGGFLGPISGIV